jgi:hypothetical protein
MVLSTAAVRGVVPSVCSDVVVCRDVVVFSVLVSAVKPLG